MIDVLETTREGEVYELKLGTIVLMGKPLAQLSRYCLDGESESMLSRTQFAGVVLAIDASVLKFLCLYCMTYPRDVAVIDSLTNCAVTLLFAEGYKCSVTPKMVLDLLRLKPVRLPSNDPSGAEHLLPALYSHSFGACRLHIDALDYIPLVGSDVRMVDLLEWTPAMLKSSMLSGDVPRDHVRKILDALSRHTWPRPQDVEAIQKHKTVRLTPRRTNAYDHLVRAVNASPAAQPNTSSEEIPCSAAREIILRHSDISIRPDIRTVEIDLDNISVLDTPSAPILRDWLRGSAIEPGTILIAKGPDYPTICAWTTLDLGLVRGNHWRQIGIAEGLDPSIGANWLLKIFVQRPNCVSVSTVMRQLTVMRWPTSRQAVEPMPITEVEVQEFGSADIDLVHVAGAQNLTFTTLGGTNYSYRDNLNYAVNPNSTPQYVSSATAATSSDRSDNVPSTAADRYKRVIIDGMHYLLDIADFTISLFTGKSYGSIKVYSTTKRIPSTARYIMVKRLQWDSAAGWTDLLPTQHPLISADPSFVTFLDGLFGTGHIVHANASPQNQVPEDLI